MAYQKTLAVRDFHKKSPGYLASMAPKPVQKTDRKPKYRKVKCSRGPAIDWGHRSCSHALASTLMDWLETKLGHRCGGKNLPLESFSAVSFAGSSRLTVLFQTVCLKTSEL